VSGLELGWAFGLNKAKCYFEKDEYKHLLHRTACVSQWNSFMSRGGGPPTLPSATSDHLETGVKVGGMDISARDADTSSLCLWSMCVEHFTRMMLTFTLFS